FRLRSRRRSADRRQWNANLQAAQSSAHPITPSPPEQQSPILGPRQGPGAEHLPASRDKPRSAKQLWSGGKNGVNGGTTARQRGNFGPSPDEPAFQLCQLRPLREDDVLKVVFGRFPICERELWPRAETT